MKWTSLPQVIRSPWGLRLTATQCHDGEVKLFINSLVFGRGSLITIVTVGIDLAKNVFVVHGVDEAGKPVLVRPNVPRAKLLELITALPPCLIGMEACFGAHHWARSLAERRGHWRAIVAIAAENAARLTNGAPGVRLSSGSAAKMQQ